MPMINLRVGQGMDVHPLVSGRPCILGGVHIPSDKGPSGHSDADVLLHAVIDALLGAVGAGDIGQMFPDSDSRWKGASSLELLRMAWAKVSGAGWRVMNVDCSLLLEKPKVAPHIPAMKRNISEVLGLPLDAVGIKATTCEGLGFVGRGEGVLASASALLSREA